MQKEIVLVSYYDWYEKRLSKVENVCKELGYEVKCYTSNFDHMTKKKREPIYNENVILIDVPKYKKNISVSRLYSLWVFSRKVRKLLLKGEPEIVYCIVPPNSLVKNIILPEHRYKVIFDVMDLWPESMPIGFFEKSFIYKKWKKLRDDYIKKADYIITECDLFKEKIERNTSQNKLQTIHLTRNMSIFNNQYDLDMDTINLCYLGSINNIIDIDAIAKLIKELSYYKPVILHIIGIGEKKEELLNAAEASGATVFDHGVIYDKQAKQEIFQQCHYGLNIYKENTCIGLTIKTIDYFENGLPILNSIGADTKQLVDTYGCGYNLKNIDFEHISCCYDYRLRIRSREVFDLFFTDEILIRKVTEVLKELIIEDTEEIKS